MKYENEVCVLNSYYLFGHVLISYSVGCKPYTEKRRFVRLCWHKPHTQNLL